MLTDVVTATRAAARASVHADRLRADAARHERSAALIMGVAGAALDAWSRLEAKRHRDTAADLRRKAADAEARAARASRSLLED